MQEYITSEGILKQMGADPGGFIRVMRGSYPFPQVISVEPTNNCNLRCIMCNRKQGRTHGYMGLDLYQKIIDECAAFNPRVWLNLAGEPLLHSGIIDFISYAKQQGLSDVCMNTNAVHLDGPMSDRIIESGLDLLSVSIDSLRKEVFESIRVGADFDQVVENVMLFLEKRNKYRAAKLRFDVSFLRMVENSGETGAFRTYWLRRLHPGDSVSFARWNTRVNPAKEAWQGSLPSPRLPCLQLWRNSVVAWNGDAFICYGDFEGISKVGNVNTSSISEIWLGNELMELRRRHLQGDTQRCFPCNGCREWFTENQTRYQRFFKE